MPARDPAGILFVHRSPKDGWKVLLAWGKQHDGTWRWTGPGGEAKLGEQRVDAAFRETSEEWFGCQVLETIPDLKRCLPRNFNRLQLGPGYRNNWNFVTFVVEVEQEFQFDIRNFNFEFALDEYMELHPNEDRTAFLPKWYRHNELRALCENTLMQWTVKSAVDRYIEEKDG